LSPVYEKHDAEILDTNSCKLILSGLRKKQQISNRGSQGIVLSSKGVEAWRAWVWTS